MRAPPRELQAPHRGARRVQVAADDREEVVRWANGRDTTRDTELSESERTWLNLDVILDKPRRFWRRQTDPGPIAPREV